MGNTDDSYYSRIADAAELLALSQAAVALQTLSKDIHTSGDDIEARVKHGKRLFDLIRELVEARNAPPAVACEAADAADRCGRARAGGGEFMQCTRKRGHDGPCAMVDMLGDDPFALVDYSALKDVFDRWVCRGIYNGRVEDVMWDVVQELRRQWKERGR